MKIILAGGGKTVFFLCRSLISKGHRVVIINPDEDECINIARQLSATIICGDASDTSVLQEAGAMSADAVLAITPNDHDNLIICQLAKLNFEVHRTVSLANDPENVEIFQALGIFAFSTTHVIATLIEQHATIEQVISQIPLDDGRVNVTEMLLDSNSPVVGKTLSEVNLPQNALVAVVIRDNLPIIPRGGCRMQSGDHVVLVTLPENHGSVLKTFSREI